jgi:hypothetical protein
MRTLMFSILILTLCSAAAWGQADPKYSGHGYVFFSPALAYSSGHSAGLFHVGGGGEALLYKGLGAGAEIGYLSSWRYSGSGLGLLSLNGSYYAHAQRSVKLTPFVTGGYSRAFNKHGGGNAVNFGGGLQYWFHDRAAVRLEVRDHIPVCQGCPTVHILGFRAGLAFR